MPNIPAITGNELIRLLKRGGWTEHRQTRHGMALRKKIGDETLVTIVPTKNKSLPIGTLREILGPNQTRLGSEGLARLIEEF